MLAGKHLAGPAKACLHFINDQKRSTLVAKPGDARQIFAIRRVNAALPLNDFQYNRRSGLIDGLLHCAKIVVRNVTHVRDQWQKGFTVSFVPGGRKCSHGAPVKSAHGGNNSFAAGGKAGKFESRFYGFCTGIAEEDPIQPW
ncbi:hypothetical protein SDC9_116385 [bioreactor metagenome]|uniref:Uncharacterized protein n=1 Tax=bioreactor metagenome TaxID=1076179 RepID=A0A645BVH5_9ZZZZ